eukprot:TRINITY_DN10057_c0_g1_i1.p1 TRINITY_DN10057_c0_g1~~TRINITY_DN10057_c0_g1_i1.p1  ORF type:complete len:669 (-),score=227.06 TRINITY_DN10057_c0_g1_i1:34-2040(-)
MFDENHPLRAAILAIDEELSLTPWNLTSNFVQAMQGKCGLKLTGFGDPSRRGEAFSFLRSPLKIGSSRKQEMRDREERSAVMGTSADLRRLSLEDSRHVLLNEFGLSEEEVPPGRWERIALVRKLSNEAKSGGEDNSFRVKFARGTRYSMQHVQEQMDTKLETIFMNQIKALSMEDPLEEDSSWSDDDSLEDLEKYLTGEGGEVQEEKVVDVEVNLEIQRQKEDEEERRKMLQWMKETSAPVLKPLVQETSTIISLNGEPVGNGLIRQVVTPDPGQTYYLKRTRKIPNDDGPDTVMIDIVTNSEEIEKVIAEFKKQERSGVKRLAMNLSEEDVHKRMANKKEKRRIQEQVRRQKNIQKNQKILQERYKAGSKDGTLPRCNVTLKCGRCGMFGHMKTNKSCPVYFPEEEELEKEAKEARELEKRLKEEEREKEREREHKEKAEKEKEREEERREKEREEKEREREKEREERREREREKVHLGKETREKSKDEKVKKETEKEEEKERKVVEFKGTSLRIALLGGPKDDRKRKATEEPQSIKPKKKPRTTKKNPEALLEAIFENIINILVKDERLIAFREPVDVKDAPDYYQVIKEPIDLQKIQHNIRRHKYKSSTEFLEDFELLRSNCVEYNTTRYGFLIREAQYLLDLVNRELNMRQKEISDLEEKIGS